MQSLKKVGKIVICIVLIIMLICAVYFGYQVFINNQSVTVLSKYGSRGNEVIQIQTKLKRWGYYNGSVDGIAGPKKLAAMGIYSSSSSSSSASNSSDLNLLSRLVYGEARGEPYTGQVAVAAVVLNRVKSSSFPNTIAGVIYQAGAFDVVSDGQINLTPNETAKKAAQDAMNGWDPSYGAIYYFNPKTATSAWIWSRPMTVTIGEHRFCK